MRSLWLAALLSIACSFEAGGLTSLHAPSLWISSGCDGGAERQLETGETHDMGRGWSCLVTPLDRTQAPPSAEVHCWAEDDAVDSLVECGGDDFSGQVGRCGLIVQCLGWM